MSVEAQFLRYRETGDPEALGYVFDQLAPRLMPLALHLCPDPSDAEDALQATFVVAIERAAAFDRGRPLAAWLTGILTLQCKRVHERRGRRRERELVGEATDPADETTPLAVAERLELVATLRQHIETLPEEQRQALLLQLQHSLRPAEIAEVLAVPAGTVRVRLHRGVQALRKLLPAGLAAWLLGAFPSRGLAAIRRAVVLRARAAPASAPAVGSLWLGKRLLGGAALALLGLLTWTVWPADASRRSEPMADVPAPVAAAAGGAPVATPERTPRRAEVQGDGQAQQATAALVLHVVRKHDGRPLPQVGVRFLQEGCDPAFAARDGVTGSDGTARFTALPAGPGTVTVDRGATGGVTLVAGRSTTVTLTVDPGTAARGRVVDPLGAPVPDAQLWVDNEDVPRGSFPVGVTDASGEFTLHDLRPRVAVGASHRDFAPSWCVPVPEDGAPMVLRLLDRGAAVAGVVLGPGGFPIPGAVVEVGRLYGQRRHKAEDGSLWRGWAPQCLVTGAEGRFEAAGVAAGEIELLVRARGFLPHIEHLATRTGAATAVEVRLQAAATVRGTVRDEQGCALAGAVVRCEGIGRHVRASMRTLADGRFLLTTADPTWMAVTVHADGFATYQSTRQAAPGAALELEVRLRRLRSLRLLLRDERGAPLPGWQAAAAKAAARVATSAADGRVALWEEDGQPLELWLAMPGSRTFFACAWLRELPTDRELEVVVPDGRLPAGWIQAIVVNHDGSPWSGWSGLSRDGRLAGEAQVRGGQLRLGPLPAGEFELGLRTHVGDAAPRRTLSVTSPGTLDLGELRLPATGRLVVRCARLDGAPLADANLFLDPGLPSERNVPLDARAEADVALPAGTYRYKLWAENTRWAMGSVMVTVGETVRLELRPDPGTRRGLYFPVPLPDEFGTPANVRYVLRDPQGETYDEGDFDPREELPYYTWPMLYPGTWQLELCTDQGRRFSGSFPVDSLAASFVPIRIPVRPAR